MRKLKVITVFLLLTAIIGGICAGCVKQKG